MKERTFLDNENRKSQEKNQIHLDTNSKLESDENGTYCKLSEDERGKSLSSKSPLSDYLPMSPPILASSPVQINSSPTFRSSLVSGYKHLINPSLPSSSNVHVSMNKIPDGRYSVEHQLSIHINDLVDVGQQYIDPQNSDLQENSLVTTDTSNTHQQSQEPISNFIKKNLSSFKLDLYPKSTNALDSGIELMDVLRGLEYVMQFRVQGGKMPNLDMEMMKRLSEALLSNCSSKKRRKDSRSSSSNI